MSAANMIQSQENQDGENVVNNSGPVSPRNSIIDRAKTIILTPKETWPVIDPEPATIGGLYTGYAMILAAIPALAGLFGGLIFGYGALGFSYRPSAGAAIGMALTQYLLSLISVAVVALIIDWLAPRFGGVSNRVQAFKVSVYSATAAWLAGIFALIPALSVLGLLGLYSLYLLYTGLPLLMKAPAEKAMGYTVVTIIAAIVISLATTAVVAPIGRMIGGTYPGIAGSPGGEITVPGVGTIDVGKINEASERMAEATAKMEDAAKTGTSATIDPATLQMMLPVAIGGYKRTEIESLSIGSGAQAQARYEADGRSFRVQITDMAAVGALAGMGAALNVQSNRQTETGYERTSTVNGQIVSERWDNQLKDGQYSVTIANRFLLQAEGQAESMDNLKAAVAAVGPDKLAALAK